VLANLDKREFLNPHAFGDGAKLGEFAASAGGTMSALALLLARHNGRGGGDARTSHPVVGSWAGDRIAIVGDYGDAEDLLGDDERAAFPGTRLCDLIASDAGAWRDVSGDALLAMLEDGRFVGMLLERIGPTSWCWGFDYHPGVRERLLACARERAA
jgi:hypothetical protein